MTGVCRICGHSFSSWSECETICPNCVFSENLHNRLNVYCSTDSINTISTNNNDFTTLTIMAQKIVLENGGIQLVIDNDTIKSINTIEVNGIRFIKSGDCNGEM